MTRHKLGNNNEYTFGEIADKVNNGGSFVVYRYTVSLLAITLRLFSPAYFIAPGESKSKYAGKWNTRSRLCGWWALPWGPIRTLESFSLNNKGGIDVTDDILANLTEDGYKEGYVTIQKVASPFEIPNKTEAKYLQKSLEEMMMLHPNLKEAFFALYVNPPDGGTSSFAIGLPEDFCTDEHIAQLKKILKKYFMANAVYDFIRMKAGDPIADKLAEDGAQVRPGS
jgi:hypothetical protein